MDLSILPSTTARLVTPNGDPWDRFFYPTLPIGKPHDAKLRSSGQISLSYPHTPKAVQCQTGILRTGFLFYPHTWQVARCQMVSFVMPKGDHRDGFFFPISHLASLVMPNGDTRDGFVNLTSHSHNHDRFL